MKKIALIPALLLPLAGLVAGFAYHTAPGSSCKLVLAAGIPAFSNTSGFAVVELFTSEGCSSCPPADKALAEAAGEYPTQVYTLEFHVDYWNRLGWKDIYSAAGYTQRQKEYAQAFNLESIYTPEAVVNGQKEFVGSDQDKLNTTIKAELSTTTNIPLGLTAANPAGGKVVVRYDIKDPGAATTLQLALVQTQASSQVLRGENQGLHLQHGNVVRDFRSLPIHHGTSFSGNAELTIPEGLTAKGCKVIAFLQNGSGRITGAETASLQ
ncbi:MAG TPA: DUF1223 domain-containing protein [Puia sp.]|jgi:hypothetical protein